MKDEKTITDLGKEIDEKLEIRKHVLRYMYKPKNKFKSIEEYYKNLESIENIISSTNSINELNFSGQESDKFSIENEYENKNYIDAITKQEEKYKEKMVREEEREENSGDPTKPTMEKDETVFIPIDTSYEPIFPQVNKAREEEKRIRTSELKQYLCDNGFMRRTEVHGNMNYRSTNFTDYEIFDEEETHKKIQKREPFYTASNLKELSAEAKKCAGYNPDSYIIRVKHEFKL